MDNDEDVIEVGYSLEKVEDVDPAHDTPLRREMGKPELHSAETKEIVFNVWVTNIRNVKRTRESLLTEYSQHEPAIGWPTINTIYRWIKSYDWYGMYQQRAAAFLPFVHYEMLADITEAQKQVPGEMLAILKSPEIAKDKGTRNRIEAARVLMEFGGMKEFNAGKEQTRQHPSTLILNEIIDPSDTIALQKRSAERLEKMIERRIEDRHR